MSAVAIIDVILAFFRSSVGRWVGGALIVAMAYGAGDIRGRRVEHAKCEARAKAAAEAAVAQDRSAQKRIDENNSATLEDLIKQKDVADARVRELETTLANSVVKCAYGDNGQPDTGGVQHSPSAGARDKGASRPARILVPRPRPAGDKG